MKDKYDKYNAVSEILTANGWRKVNFYYQVGNEDENNDYIFCKDGIVLWWSYDTNHWWKGEMSRCNYINGIDISGGVIDIEQYLS